MKATPESLRARAAALRTYAEALIDRLERRADDLEEDTEFKARLKARNRTIVRTAKLTAQGYTLDQLAEKLCRMLDNIDMAGAKALLQAEISPPASACPRNTSPDS